MIPLIDINISRVIIPFFGKRYQVRQVYPECFNIDLVDKSEELTVAQLRKSIRKISFQLKRWVLWAAIVSILN